MFGVFLFFVYFCNRNGNELLKQLHMKYPIGIQNFESLRKDEYVYVDKTAWVYQLASTGRYYFLSRPRRFGKSLLVSTLEAYFQGKRELFSGLALERLETAWNEYPILHLDFNVEYYNSMEVLRMVLDDALQGWERDFGVPPTTGSHPLRFKNLIKSIYEKTGQRVVVLVDEYDKPLLQTMDKEDLQDELRNALKAFYGILKPADKYLRFALFTGVTKFSKVSVFSDLNNLNDISMDPRYAEICGITEREIRDFLGEDVARLAAANQLSTDDCYRQLREKYDGYHFVEDGEGLYNPFSLINTLAKLRFSDYWFETGTPSYLVEIMKNTNYPLEQLEHEEISTDLLGSLDSIRQTPVPLLYQSGYLTIKGADREFGNYRLGFPNQEVEQGFVKNLMPYYSSVKPEQSSVFVVNFVRDIRAGRVNDFMQRLDTLFAGGDYQVAGDAELYFQNAVWVIFKMIGFFAEVERRTADGRIDLLMKTQDYIYIMEFKLDKSADEALAQIEEKQYAKPFEHDGRTIYKIGVNFSTSTRRIDGWSMTE